MLNVHESWREEIGWMFILVGLVALAWGWLNLETRAALPDSEAVSLLLMGLGIALACLGAVLHVTRPGRPRLHHPSPRQRAMPPAEPIDYDGM